MAEETNGEKLARVEAKLDAVYELLKANGELLTDLTTFVAAMVQQIPGPDTLDAQVRRLQARARSRS